MTKTLFAALCLLPSSVALVWLGMTAAIRAYRGSR